MIGVGFGFEFEFGLVSNLVDVCIEGDIGAVFEEAPPKGGLGKI
jgi:hypothetical protein